MKSRAISALGYDTRKRRLGIEFLENSEVYFYFEVPRADFEEFLAADSKGRYLTLVFLKKNYRFTGPHKRRKHTVLR